jgi:hypothetical protein
VLPNSKDVPAAFCEFSTDERVTHLVSVKFSRPKLAIGFWNTAVLRATVPETSIDKDSKARGHKCKIWIAENRRAPAPSFNLKFSKNID